MSISIDETRIRSLVGELSPVETEEPLSEMFTPNFYYVVEIFDPMKIIGGERLYLILHELIPSKQAVDGSYKYFIKLLDLAPQKSVPALAWQGPTNHPRLTELIQYVNKCLVSLEAVCWEEFTAARIQAQLQAIQASEEIYRKWKQEFLEKFWQYYQQNLPPKAKILIMFSKEKIEFRVVNGELVCEAPSDIIGHLIGKQGVHAKALEQILGTKIHFIAKQ